MSEEAKPHKLCLNIGCGGVRPQNDDEHTWIHLDIDKSVNPDVVRDITKGLPYDDDKFAIVFCSHVLEHFGGAEFVFVMNEIHRVLKHNGELHILGPYYKHWGAWTDPFHRMFFREQTFEPYWFPSNSSVSMGIEGFFMPIIVHVAEEKELRVVMRKVHRNALREYVDKIGVKLENGSFVAPDFLKIVEGRVYGQK